MRVISTNKKLQKDIRTSFLFFITNLITFRFYFYGIHLIYFRVLVYGEIKDSQKIFKVFSDVLFFTSRKPFKQEAFDVWFQI